MSAATAATCGAAAEVPKKGLKGGSVVVTPSVPVRSGLKRTSGTGKRIVEGPAALKDSKTNGLLAGEAATARTAGTAAWPSTLEAGTLNSSKMDRTVP